MTHIGEHEALAGRIRGVLEAEYDIPLLRWLVKASPRAFSEERADGMHAEVGLCVGDGDGLLRQAVRLFVVDGTEEKAARQAAGVLLSWLLSRSQLHIIYTYPREVRGSIRKAARRVSEWHLSGRPTAPGSS